MTIRYASLCTGISCESVAWLPLGWKPVFFAEIDPFACAVLSYHYPDVPNLGDIRKIDGCDWRGKVDVLIAGTPCQGFSLAGKRGMLDDPRSNLALEYARILNEAQIPVGIFENVPGILAGDAGVFATVLGRIVGAETLPQPPSGKWPGAGMAAGPSRIAAWRMADSQYFRVAQRRRRLFAVSVDIGERLNPGAVLFEPERLPRDTPPGEQARPEVARCVGASTGGASAKEQQLTFVSGDNQPLNALGSPPVYPLQEIGRRPSQNGSGVGASDDPMFTLQAGSRHGIAHTLRGEGHDASEDGTSRGTPLTVSLRGRDGGNTAELGSCLSNALRAGTGGSDKPHVLDEMAVRRLTPRETERLQGLPDDYTLIPYGKGNRQTDIVEMAAYWGVSVKEALALAADSHRYRAVGNGMAVPVVRWLGERVELVMRLVGYVPVEERHFQQDDLTGEFHAADN